MSTYNLQIRATDSGVPELMSFALVQVQVNDVNDNPPLFSQHNYSAFVHVSIIHANWPLLCCKMIVNN